MVSLSFLSDDRIFERDAFERERTSTDSGVEGTGLGLAITKRIVDLMGGTIEVLTAPGSGTEIILRFKFRLANEEEIHKEAVVEETAAEEITDFSGKRLLLVEDNAINMEIAKMILEQMGFSVETAENGQIAVENTQLANVPILAMTANAFQEDVQAAMDAGMQAHIAKPINIGVLTETLQSVITS